MDLFTAHSRCQAKELPDNSLLPPPFEDPLPTWNLWNDIDNVKAIIVGLLHADSELGPNEVTAILHARNPLAYGTMTSRDVEFIFSWLRNNPNAPNNPYKTMFDKGEKDPESSNVYATMRASILLGLLETEAGIPRAKEKAHERMEMLKYAAKLLKKMDATMKEIRGKEKREKEQENELWEKYKEIEGQRLAAEWEKEKKKKKAEEAAGTTEE